MARGKQTFLSTILMLSTWPYAVSLEGYTLGPLREVLEHVDDHDVLKQKTVAFLSGKEYEFRLVYLGAALGVAATVGVFSWDSIYQTTWFAHLCWFTALLLAVFANFAANQLSPIIYGLTASSTKEREVELRDGFRALYMIGLRGSATGDPEAQSKAPRRMSWAMMYAWQGPMMLMGWSWSIFLFGLIIHATAPLRDDRDTGNNIKAASCVLTAYVILASNFIGTSVFLKAARMQADVWASEQVEHSAIEMSAKSSGTFSMNRSRPSQP